MTVALAIFAAVCVVSFTAGALSGFGSVVIALTLASHVQSIEWMVPRLVALNLILNGYLVIAYRGRVAWRLLLTRLLPLMGLGSGVGVLASSYLAGPTLKTLFGALVVLLSIVELYRLYRRAEPAALGGTVHPAFVLAAGVMHGIYASGGPLLVYALGKAGLDRTMFRSTLATIWLVLNVALTIVFFADGRLDAGAMIDVAWLVPPVVLAMVIGEKIHHRVDERTFRIVLFSLLLAAGASLLVKQH